MDILKDVEEKVDYFAERFGKEGKRYYLSVFQKFLDYKYRKDDIETTLNILVNEGKLIRGYDLKCMYCNHTIAHTNIRKHKKIDFNFCCEHCNRELKKEETYELKYYKIK